MVKHNHMALAMNSCMMVIHMVHEPVFFDMDDQNIYLDHKLGSFLCIWNSFVRCIAFYHMNRIHFENSLCYMVNNLDMCLSIR